VNEGVNIPPKEQISPLGARGEVKNCPLAFSRSLEQLAPKFFTAENTKVYAEKIKKCLLI
jgi:hypothetical protein